MLSGAFGSLATHLTRSIGDSVRMFRSHAKDRTNDARSSTALYRFPACQRGDRKSSVPTLDRNVASEVPAKQLTSKSFRKRSPLMINMSSGLTSLCNTPAMCKPVTACKSSTYDCDDITSRKSSHRQYCLCKWQSSSQPQAICRPPAHACKQYTDAIVPDVHSSNSETAFSRELPASYCQGVATSESSSQHLLPPQNQTPPDCS